MTSRSSGARREPVPCAQGKGATDRDLTSLAMRSPQVEEDVRLLVEAHVRTAKTKGAGRHPKSVLVWFPLTCSGATRARSSLSLRAAQAGGFAPSVPERARETVAGAHSAWVSMSSRASQRLTVHQSRVEIAGWGHLYRFARAIKCQRLSGRPVERVREPRGLGLPHRTPHDRQAKQGAVREA